MSLRWRRSRRSGLTFSVFLWRRCDTWKTLKCSSVALSSLTTSSTVCELRSCCRAPTGASHQTRCSPAAPGTCRPPPAQRTRLSTGPCPPGSASRHRLARPSGSGSVWYHQGRARTALRRAAVFTRRRVTTSSYRSPCMMLLSLPQAAPQSSI